MEPNKTPNRERALMLSPASALKARLAKNMDMVKPIPHKLPRQNLFEVDALWKFCNAKFNGKITETKYAEWFSDN